MPRILRMFPTKGILLISFFIAIIERKGIIDVARWERTRNIDVARWERKGIIIAARWNETTEEATSICVV